MWQKIFSMAIKYGLKAAGRDAKVQWFKIAYREFGRDVIMSEIVEPSKNQYDDRLTQEFDRVLKMTD